MNNIKIVTKLSFNDFLRVNYYLLYRTLHMKVLTLLGIVCFIFPIIQYEEGEEFNYLAFVFGAITILIPIFQYFVLKKNYYNTRINEPIIYEFNDEVVQVKGTTFYSTFTWDKVYKVSELKTWIFLWQTRYSILIIPKKNLNPNELQQLKYIVNSHKEVKNKMK